LHEHHSNPAFTPTLCSRSRSHPTALPTCSTQQRRRLGAEAAARLVRLEASAAQQAQQVSDLARQLDKLSVRSRLLGRDLKLPIQQVGGWVG